MSTKCEELLAANGVDYAEAMERFGGNKELYKRIAVKFLDDPHYEELRQALDNNDAEGAYRHTHALKGVVGNLSFGNLYRAACRITDALRTGDVAAARALMVELTEAHATVVAGLMVLKKGGAKA